MKLFDRLRGNLGKVFHLLAGLGHRLAGMAHFANQFLRHFSIFTQAFGSLLKHPQHLPDTALLFALEIGQFADALAARLQVADDRLELTANGLVLLTFRTVNDSLQTCDELIDFGLAIGAFLQEQAVQRADSSVDHFTDARQTLPCRGAEALNFRHGFVESRQHGLQLGRAQANYFSAVGQSWPNLGCRRRRLQPEEALAARSMRHRATSVPDRPARQPECIVSGR